MDMSASSRVNIGLLNPSWLSQEAGGEMTYFETLSTTRVVPSYLPSGGQIGYSCGVRSSSVSSGASICYGSYAAANSNLTVWNYYGTATRYPNATQGIVLGYEQDICNQGLYVSQDAYTSGNPGMTANIWLGGSSEWNAAYPGICNTTTMAIGLQGFNNQFGKGIVFRCNSILGADCSNIGTTGVAIQMSYGQQIEWIYQGNTPGSYISSVSSTNIQEVMRFEPSGIFFRDLASFTPLFKISNPGTSNSNYITVIPAASGSNPTLFAQGSDTNVNLYIETQGNASSISLIPGGKPGLAVIAVANSTNSIQIFPALSGSPPKILATGTDANIDLLFETTGSGLVYFNQQPSVGNTSFTVSQNLPVKVYGATYYIPLVHNRVITIQVMLLPVLMVSLGMMFFIIRMVIY